jgi:hypothetical protein
LLLISVTAFAIVYTLGNILSLTRFVLKFSWNGAQTFSQWCSFSSGFLLGPLRQLKNMFAPTRLIATLVFIVMMIVTVVVAVVVPIDGVRWFVEIREMVLTGCCRSANRFWFFCAWPSSSSRSSGPRATPDCFCTVVFCV